MSWPLRVAAASIMAAASMATVAGEPRAVFFEAEDGFELAGSYFNPGQPGPGILLLHQCNADRSMWDVLGSMLADSGLHVLALDYRGFGDSRSEGFDLSETQGDEERIRIHSYANGDVAAAYRKLLATEGVDTSKIGIGGASCGGNRSLELAATVDGIRAMVFLSTGLNDESMRKLRDVPVLAISAEGDARATSALRSLFERSGHPDSRLILHKGNAHGAPLFEQDPRLRQTIVDWYRDRLRGTSATPPCVDSDDLVIDGDCLHHEASGTGFPLILVSGGSGMDSRQWDAVEPRLAERFRVIRFDPRGVGRSDNPTSRYSDAADLERLLDHLGFERAAIVGLSSSGGLVLEFALAHPERVVAVVAAAPFVPGFRFDTDMRRRLAGFSEAAQAGKEPFLDTMFADAHFLPAPLDPDVRARAREIMAFNFDKAATVDASLSIAPDPPLLERLGAIQPPVLLVVGALDHPEVVRRNGFLARTIPNASETTVADSGHTIPVENPSGFLRAILPFLDEQMGR